jgi:hypothetical protein
MRRLKTLRSRTQSRAIMPPYRCVAASPVFGTGNACFDVTAAVIAAQR